MRTEYLEVLELLPMWQLRHPLPNIPQTVAPSDSQKVMPESIEQPVAQTGQMVMHFASEEGALQLLHLADGMSADAQQLLQNIANSMQLKRQSSAGQALDAALGSPANVLLVLGESLANAVLGSQQDLQALRGEAHLVEAKQVVVSYDLDAMLDQPAIKAQVWQDCCLALSLLAEKAV